MAIDGARVAIPTCTEHVWFPDACFVFLIDTPH